MKYTSLSMLATGILAWAFALAAVAADVEQLTGNVSSPDEETRASAARDLGGLGPAAAAAVPALIKALDDESPQVRGYAAIALGEIGDSSAAVVDALIANAFDPDPATRRASLKALRKLDPPKEKVLPLGLKLLEEGDPAIVMAAMQTLAEEGPTVVPRLCEVLDNDKACYWACLVLAEIGPGAKAAVPHLKGVLAHKDAEVRMQALVTLGEIGPDSKSLLPDVVALLENDPNDGVRYGAAFAVGKIGVSPTATEALEKAVADGDPFLCMISAWALARNNPDDKALVQRAIDLILKAFKSDDVYLRRAAAKAAVDFDVPPDVVGPMLVDALQDSDPQVVMNATAALAELGPKALKHIDKLLKLKELRFYAIPLINRLGPEAESAVPALIEVLGQKPQDDEDLAFLREVQFALAGIGAAARDAVPALVKSLDPDNDDMIRASASFALGKMGPAARGAVPALRNNLRSPSLIVRLSSLRALLEILPREPRLVAVAVPLLIQGLDKEQNDLVRAECATALGELGSVGKGALPRLKALLDDESEIVRQAAADAVKKLDK